MVAPVRILHRYRGTALAPNRAGGWLNSLGNDRSDPHHLITVRATESAWARLLVLLYQHDLSRTGMLHHFCAGAHGFAWSCLRNDPFPLRVLRHTGGAEDTTGRAAAGGWSRDARLPDLSALHLGDQPGPARQAAVVGKPRALSLPRLRWSRGLAHTWASLAARRASLTGAT
jgi:hypothetical protein